MLIYCNRSFFRLVLTRYGSIFMRFDNLFMALIVAGAAAALQHLIDTDSRYAPELPHHYGMHALGVIVGFAVVFRTNLGWQRYWEAVTQLHIMYSKWGDAFSQLIAFSGVSMSRAKAKQTEEGDAKFKRIDELLEHAYRNFILMSAMAADRLTHGDTQRMEERSKGGAKWSARIVKREVLRREDLMTGGLKMPTLEPVLAKAKDSLVPDPDCRATSCDTKLEEIQNTWETKYLVRATPSQVEMEILKKSSDRTSVIMFWIIYDLAKISADLEAAPPIQSRMYQELSNGMLGMNQCVKLADVPFPFPYAQLLTMLLIVFACFIPVYIVCFTKSMIVGPIMSFALFQGIWGLNETAKELENPFGPDVNDITIGDFHLRFLDSLQEVYIAHCLKMEPDFSLQQAVLAANKQGRVSARITDGSLCVVAAGLAKDAANESPMAPANSTLSAPSEAAAPSPPATSENGSAPGTSARAQETAALLVDGSLDAAIEAYSKGARENPQKEGAAYVLPVSA
mmetsp:Transcript_43860/g.80347  ORF Transcript_43860/g.80347 Transcript_43860/m.80347 type:complete len:511 (+) Transcript_43860:87-1619(+)